MRLICSTSFLPMDTPRTALAKVAWAGFETVELAIADFQAPLPTAGDLQDDLEDERLALAGISTPALDAGSEAASLNSAAAIGRLCAWSAEAGGGVLRMAAPPAEQSQGEWVRCLLRLLSALAERKPTSAVRICLEPRPGTLLPTLAAVWEMLTELDHPALGYALDLSPAAAAGVTPETAADWPSLPEMTTLSLEASSDWTENRLVEWIAALRGAGYEGGVTLTHPGGDPWELEARAMEARQWLETLLTAETM